MSTSSSSIATLIRRYRVARGWTQDELGQRAGISMRTISDIERGLSRYPHRDTIQQLIVAFELKDEAAHSFQQAARAGIQSVEIVTGIQNLPQPTTPFVGRETDIVAAQNILTHTQQRLLTLVGPAGVGKTRLMVEIARTTSQAKGSNSDTNWYFVDLTQASTTEDVMSEIIRQLGIPEQKEHTSASILDNWLYQRRCSLILDNFEQSIQATPLIEHLLMMHQSLTICITSRIPLKIAAEIVQEVAPFPIVDYRRLTYATLRHESVMLIFEAIAQTVSPTFTLTATNSPTIARICARLDGLPLGIELVAAQIAHYSLTDLLRQLSRIAGTVGAGFSLPLVSGRPRRQQNLVNAIAWSYDLLETPVQILYRRLCIFAGEFDVEAVQEICNPHDTLAIDTIDGLSLLLDHHLLQSVAIVDPAFSPRFTMLAVIRDFGRDLLLKRGELNTLKRQHAYYYADLLLRHEADFVGELQGQRLTLFTRDYDNILAALRQAREQQDVILGANLVSSLWWYWEKRRTLTEGREWIEHVISQVNSYNHQIDPATLGRVYYGAAVLANAQGDVAQAQQYAQVCLQNCITLHDDGRIGQVHTLLGTIATTANDIATALQEYEQALAVLRQFNSPRQLAPILNNISALAIEQGDFIRARTFLEESLTIKRQLGDQRGVAVGLINLGEWRKQQGELEQALADIAEAEHIFTELGDQVGMAMAANNTGEVALSRHDFATAQTALQRSLALFKRSENRNGIALVHRNLGDAFHIAGKDDAAVLSWQASLNEQPTGTNADHCRASLAAIGLSTE